MVEYTVNSTAFQGKKSTGTGSSLRLLFTCLFQDFPLQTGPIFPGKEAGSANADPASWQSYLSLSTAALQLLETVNTGSINPSQQAYGHDSHGHQPTAQIDLRHHPLPQPQRIGHSNGCGQGKAAQHSQQCSCSLFHRLCLTDPV